MENVSWKLKGLANGVSPQDAVDELKRLQNVYGKLTPEVIVKEASRKKSPLHPIFEWDSEKAAYNFRLQQARVLLNNISVSVITDGEERKISVYEVTTKSEGYKSIDTFTPDDIEYIRQSAKQQLTHLREKIRLYSEFDKVVILIGEAIEAI